MERETVPSRPDDHEAAYAALPPFGSADTPPPAVEEQPPPDASGAGPAGADRTAEPAPQPDDRDRELEDLRRFRQQAEERERQHRQQLAQQQQAQQMQQEATIRQQEQQFLTMVQNGDLRPEQIREGYAYFAAWRENQVAQTRQQAAAVAHQIGARDFKAHVAKEHGLTEQERAELDDLDDLALRYPDAPNLYHREAQKIVARRREREQTLGSLEARLRQLEAEKEAEADIESGAYRLGGPGQAGNGRRDPRLDPNAPEYDYEYAYTQIPNIAARRG